MNSSFSRKFALDIMLCLLQSAEETWGITVFKIFIWGGISSDIRSEITFHDSRSNENFENGYPHSNAALTGHPTKCDVINDIKLFITCNIVSQTFDVILSVIALQK